MLDKFKGTGVALVTPFHKDGNIDFKSLGKIIKYQIKNEIDYLVVLGTTGESATLNKDEKRAVINYIIDEVEGRLPIVLGVGGNNTQEVINYIKSTDFKDIDAILSVSPSYNKPQQKGIYAHYKSIAAVANVPIIIYNVPSRTGSNITAETTVKIAQDLKNIIGIKEASGNISQIMQIIKNKPKDFMVISGDDAITLPLIALGASGVISVVANAYPKEFSNLVKLCLKGEFAKALDIQYKLIDIIDAMFVDGSPAGVKAFLEIKKLCVNHCRLPLVSVSKSTYNHITELAAKIK